MGAFPCQLDYTSVCTSAVQVVFSTILTQMHEDNSIIDMYNTYVQSSRTTVNCTAVQEAAAAIAIDIKDIRGIYIIFALMAFASIIPMLLTAVGVRSLKNPSNETQEDNLQIDEFSPPSKPPVAKDSEDISPRNSRVALKSQLSSNPTTTDYDTSAFLTSSRDSILAVSTSLAQTSTSTMSSIGNTIGSGLFQSPDLGVSETLNNMDRDLGLSSLGNRLGSGIFQAPDLGRSGIFPTVPDLTGRDSIIVTPNFDVDLGLSTLGNSLGSGVFQTVPDLGSSSSIIPPAAPVFPASSMSSLPLPRKANNKKMPKSKILVSDEKESF